MKQLALAEISLFVLFDDLEVEIGVVPAKARERLSKVAIGPTRAGLLSAIVGQHEDARLTVRCFARDDVLAEHERRAFGLLEVHSDVYETGFDYWNEIRDMVERAGWSNRVDGWRIAEAIDAKSGVPTPITRRNEVQTASATDSTGESSMKVE